ncbi:hypothetical protein D9M68_677110 [compost metagenome]
MPESIKVMEEASPMVNKLICKRSAWVVILIKANSTNAGTKKANLPLVKIYVIAENK